MYFKPFINMYSILFYTVGSIVWTRYPAATKCNRSYKRIMYKRIMYLFWRDYFSLFILPLKLTSVKHQTSHHPTTINQSQWSAGCDVTCPAAPFSIFSVDIRTNCIVCALPQIYCVIVISYNLVLIVKSLQSIQ